MSKAAQYRDARIFTAGAACGFLAGAFVVAVILWEFGGLTGSRPAAQSRRDRQCDRCAAHAVPA